MCKINLRIIMLLLSLSCLARVSCAGNGAITLSGGLRYLDRETWKPMQDQLAAGVIVDWKRANWPIYLTFPILLSGAQEEDQDGRKFRSGILEMGAGVKYRAENFGRVAPYVAGGIALVSAELDGGFEDDYHGRAAADSDEIGLGGWVNTGIALRVAQHFQAGFDVRYSYSNVTLFDTKLNGGGLYGGVTFGYAW